MCQAFPQIVFRYVRILKANSLSALITAIGVRNSCETSELNCLSRFEESSRPEIMRLNVVVSS